MNQFLIRFCAGGKAGVILQSGERRHKVHHNWMYIDKEG